MDDLRAHIDGDRQRITDELAGFASRLPERYRYSVVSALRQTCEAGVRYGLPIRIGASWVFYRTDLIETFPTTWAEYEEVLAANQVPVAAAVYADDMYVPRVFSEETAGRIRGLRMWLTNEFEHDGLKYPRVLDRLIALARGMV